MKTLHLIIFYVAMAATACPTMAQETAEEGKRRQWEAVFDELMSEEADEPESWEEIYHVLSDLAEHPIDINSATREDFEQIPFLDSRQIEELCEYLYRYGPMRSVAELRLIESLDDVQRRLLRCLVYVGDSKKESFPKPADIAKYGKHTLTATAKIPFYERKGDQNGYLGYPYKHWFRYDFTYADRFRVGFSGSQDAGEPFFSAGNSMGYDFYTFYLQIKKLGRLQNLIVGRYRLSFGMGLVLNSSFSLGKTAILSGLSRGTNALRVCSSRSEADYFQGAAATVRLTKEFNVSAFASYRPLDATLNDDGSAATIVTTGYHRTQTEMEKKGNTHATTVGANVSYSSGPLRAGATAVFTRLDRQLSPNTTAIYRRHYASGRDFINLSVNYEYTSHRLTFAGETATNRSGAVATLNTIGLSLTERLELRLLQRFYSYRYTALHANSFSDGGAVQNESGVYFGADWRPTTGLQLSAYTDFARFAWPKYRISAASYSSDNLLSATCSLRRWTVAGRYRLRLRQRDNSLKTALTNRAEHRLRLYAHYDHHGQWSSRTQADLALAEQERSDRGWMVSQNVSYKHKWLLLNLSSSYFDTSGYDSRLYAYERGLPDSFSYPALYGRGIRYAVMARADIGAVMLAAKLTVTDYFDRSTIGSGYQTIYGSSTTDLEIQSRIRF